MIAAELLLLRRSRVLQLLGGALQISCREAISPAIHAPPAGLRGFSTTPAAAMKIYTKTGDAGTSALYTGERRPKDDAAFAALGDVDELNCAVGLAREHARAAFGGGGDKSSAEARELLDQLAAVQAALMDVGAAVATPPARASPAKAARTAFGGEHTAALESWIDALAARLPPLAHFILPSGGLPAAALHGARAACRRAERAVVPLAARGDAPRAAAVFLNRLSDYLFMAARAAAAAAGEPEVVWRKGG